MIFKINSLRATAATMFLVSFSLVLFELLLTRLFGVVLFAQFAHLALALALLGIGIGAVIQHLWPEIVPEEGFESRLAFIALLMGASMLVAVLCSIYFPVVEQFEKPPTVYQERSSIQGELLNNFWFSLLLPFLVVPFVFSGLAFSASFYRRKKHIGLLYGADLIGGAFGALAFVPLLGTLAGPDVVFVSISAVGLAALGMAHSKGRRVLMGISGGVVLLCLVASGIGAAGGEILKIKFAAGYAESNVTHTMWTPLTRLAVHEDERGTYILLDNSSASEVIKTEADRQRKTHEINRSFVYRLHQPPARVAILASSAGPEIAVAQAYGYTDVDAIDIAGEIAQVVRTRFPDAPVNPFRIGNTNQIKADGRAAILHAQNPYDIIQMVHANLHSNAGLLANAWSPSLLETKEAFGTYFDKLSSDGTISFGRGGSTPNIARSAAAALMERGVRDPWRYIAYMQGYAQFLLIKKKPWTPEQLTQLKKLAREAHYTFQWFPGNKPTPAIKQMLTQNMVLTDNKPYSDQITALGNTLRDWFKDDDQRTAISTLYRAIWVQIFFVIIAGILFLFIPLLRRDPTGLNKVNRVALGLIYVACLGYGYLALETVLIHELILFVGHPTYAVTVVILAMLLFSGIGSIVAGKVKEEKLTKVLLMALGTVVVLGLLQAFVFSKFLTTHALGLPLFTRLSITFVMLAPLGFVMGMPFPLAMRIIPERASGLIPWAWALNGWMSVVASLGSLLISRIVGYHESLLVAVAVYLVAFLLASRLRTVGRA